MKINRRQALTWMGLGLGAGLIGIESFRRTFMSGKNILSSDSTAKMPVLFLGHGSPMNAIESNDFTRTLARLGQGLPVPKAIVCISAHWQTRGTWVTHMQNPKTIHDFYGFPQALFDVQYPAPGSPALAEKIQTKIVSPPIHRDDSQWGLDHGTWSVLKHIYPQAQIPIVQLSMDMTQSAEYHFQLGQQLTSWRQQGVLIVGSGNIVHNLRKLSWETNAKPFDWALEFDEWVQTKILDRDFSALVNEPLQTESGRLSIPTPDHYLPLLYTLGAAEKNDSIQFIYEGIQNSSISMRCVQIG